jgi:hypothetical protein
VDYWIIGVRDMIDWTMAWRSAFMFLAAIA